jgi:hypothetical protein
MVKVPATGKSCTTGAGGMMAQSVADIVTHHVKLSVEAIDRMYLNVYVPRLQTEQGIAGSFRDHRRQPLPSATLMSPISRGFVAALEAFAARHGLPLVQFSQGQRKDEVMAEHLGKFGKEEGGWCSSAKPRRRRRCSAPRSAAIHAPASFTLDCALDGDGEKSSCHRHSAVPANGLSAVAIVRFRMLNPLLRAKALIVLPIDRGDVCNSCSIDAFFRINPRCSLSVRTVH